MYIYVFQNEAGWYLARLSVLLRGVTGLRHRRTTFTGGIDRLNRRRSLHLLDDWDRAMLLATLLALKLGKLYTIQWPGRFANNFL